MSPARSATAARAPFVLLVVTLLAGGLISLLLLNGAVNQDSFELNRLQKDTTTYTDEEQALQQDVDRYKAPDALDRRRPRAGHGARRQPRLPEPGRHRARRSHRGRGRAVPGTRAYPGAAEQARHDGSCHRPHHSARHEAGRRRVRAHPRRLPHFPDHRQVTS
ncbi:hypothetical protein M2266_001887 [Streptomyces sp. SPB162]|nr:hypothetical protein [Streptomyces sp. SPB162]